VYDIQKPGAGGTDFKAEAIKQELALMGQLRAAEQAEAQAFMQGQQDAIRSYEDLMVAGDAEAERALARARQEDALRDQRAKGFLSGDQLQAGLQQIGVQFDKETQTIGEKATENFAQAGISAAQAFAGSIKSFMHRPGPDRPLWGAALGGGAILSVIPGLQIPGMILSGAGGSCTPAARSPTSASSTGRTSGTTSGT
jgi:hypothetical protein